MTDLLLEKTWMSENHTYDLPPRLREWTECLEKVCQERSFYTRAARRPIRITFTRFRLDQIQREGLYFRLYARCSTYRGIGVLYLQIKGAFEADASQVKTSYKIGPGLPTGLFELLLGIVWNLLVISVGVILLLSAPDMPSVERVMSYGFLPLIYGVYALRLLFLYKNVSAEIPGIISDWCQL